MALLEGTLVAEKYRIIARIGEGGMGEVFHARHVAMDRDVALKLLKEIGPVDGESFKRFLREAKILGGLRHKNLVSCFEFGEWQGTAFIAMEYVDGHSLVTELAAHKTLGGDRVLKIGQQIAAALECAHKAGVTHRDMKPHNIVLCEGESGARDLVKLIDFGLARLIPQDGKTVTKLTQTGVTVGSVSYMAPEQCLGLPADARADIYAFGASMHQALRGAPPFDSPNPMDVMQMHLNEDPPPIGRDDLPVGLETVLRRCMAKDADERYQTAADLSEALDTVARGEGMYLAEFVPEVTALKPMNPETPLKKPARISIATTVAIVLALGSLAAFGLAKGMEYMRAQQELQQNELITTKDLATSDSLLSRLHQEHMQGLLYSTQVDPGKNSKAVNDLVGHTLRDEEAVIALSILAKLYGDAGQLEMAARTAEQAREYEKSHRGLWLPDPYWATAQISLRRGELGYASRAVVEAMHRVEPSGVTHIQLKRERLEGSELLAIAEKQFGKNSPEYAFATTANNQLREKLRMELTHPYSGPPL